MCQQHMPLKCDKIWNMPKLLDVYLWSRYTNINATFEVPPNNDVSWITVHWQWQWCRMTIKLTMMPQPNFILLSWPLGQISEKKTTKRNFNLPCYCHTCASNKYALKCHMPKLLDIHLWGAYANIFVTYEVAPINDVATNALIRGRHQKRRQ